MQPRTGSAFVKPPLAAVTMVFDEPTHLASWTRHYAREVGAQNCTVVDHGSDPALIAQWRAQGGQAMNYLRLPRSPQDDRRRASFLSQYCSALLDYYGAVLYTDCDELVVAEPSRHADLTAYAAALADDPSAPEVVTAAGYEVIHRAAEEPALDWTRAVGPQRRWVRFSSALCKPVMIRRPVAWAPGFHNIDAPPEFDDLSLFHLRFADEADGVGRLARTRTQPWADPMAGAHQRMADATWLDMLRGMAGLPGDERRTLGQGDEALQEWLAKLRASQPPSPDYRYALDLAPMALWRLPPRYRDRF